MVTMAAIQSRGCTEHHQTVHINILTLDNRGTPLIFNIKQAHCLLTLMRSVVTDKML